MPPSSTFVCFSGCPGTYPTTDTVTSCPSCGGLLAVEHDLDALRERDGASWRAHFDARLTGELAIDRSGVWSKREWVAPDVVQASIVTTGEGQSPLCEAPRLGRELGIPKLKFKQCGTSHTGSFKDLGMTVLVSVVRHAIDRGLMTKRALACASTGDTSAALAAYGAMAGLPVCVLLPRGRISQAQLVQPLSNGARVLALDTDFDGCMAIIKRLAHEGLIYLANSMNPLRIEGQKTVAIEVAQQMRWRVPDWVVLPSGNLGNASALHAGFSMLERLGVTGGMPRLLVAQAERANPLYRAYVAKQTEVAPVTAQRTHASAIQIGNPVSAPRAMRALEKMNGVVEQATEDELADASARADRAGMFTCPHTAVALAATVKARAARLIHEKDDVVIVSTAHGLKFTEFKSGLVSGRLEGTRREASNTPLELEADFDAVANAIRSMSEV